MATHTRSGLVSYGGDSEISDSEDERVSTGNTPPGVVAQGLGIPPSRSRQPTTPPSFTRPIVHPAPSTGLVAYSYADEDEDEHNESRDVENTENVTLEDVFIQPSTSQAVVVTQSHLQPEKGDVPVIEVTAEHDQGKSEMTRPLFLPLQNVQLPPEPAGRCSNALQEKIIKLLEKKGRLGIDLNRNVQERKDFRNPSIYDKLVQFCNLDEVGTNYPEHLFNPHEWSEDSYYDNLLKTQKKAYEKKEKAKLERTKIEFVTGTKRPAAASSLGPTTGQEAQKKQRKSKWDISSGSGGSRGNSPSKEKTSGVGAQAKAASQLSKELSKLVK